MPGYQIPHATLAHDLVPHQMCFTSPPEDPASYRVCLHAGYKDNWSLKGLDTGGAEYRRMLFERLALDGIHGDVFAPRAADMAGIVLHPTCFSHEYQISNNQTVRRNISKEAKADGVVLFLERKCGDVIFSLGGCAVNVATGITPRGERVAVVAHSGVRSLVDENRFLSNKVSRADESVVNAMARRLRKLGVGIRNATFRSFFHIAPEGFQYPLDHALYGEQNRMRRDYLNNLYGDVGIFVDVEGVSSLNIGRLIEVQAHQEAFGVVEAYHCVLPLGGDSPFCHTRHENPTLRTHSNLATIRFDP